MIENVELDLLEKDNQKNIEMFETLLIIVNIKSK
jgi:hypothetical protein